MYPLSQVKLYPLQHLGKPFTQDFAQSNSQVPCKNLELHAHLGPNIPIQTLLQPFGQLNL